jgi:hypothetical protein
VYLFVITASDGLVIITSTPAANSIRTMFDLPCLKSEVIEYPPDG